MLLAMVAIGLSVAGCEETTREGGGGLGGEGEGEGSSEGEGEGEGPAEGEGEGPAEGEGEGEGGDGICEHAPQNPPAVGPFLDCDDLWWCRKFCAWVDRPGYGDARCETNCNLWNKCDAEGSEYSEAIIHCPNRWCGLAPGAPTATLEGCLADRCRDGAEACGVWSGPEPTLGCKEALDCLRDCGAGPIYRCPADDDECMFDATLIPCGGWCLRQTREDVREHLRAVVGCVLDRCEAWDTRASPYPVTYVGEVQACGSQQCADEIAECWSR